MIIKIKGAVIIEKGIVFICLVHVDFSYYFRQRFRESIC